MKASEVKALLSELEIKPLKSLGQNFLVNQDIISKILSFHDLKSSAHIIEIGPGLGSLTRPLIKEMGLAKLDLIELDKKLAGYWADQGVQTHHTDALKYDWRAVNEDTTLVSNLPYQISSRLLIELFILNPSLKNMVLMFQKEVGDRIHAGPEDKKIYGLLSILCSLNWSVKRVTLVPKASFYPPPEIESLVLSFELKKDFDLKERRAFVEHLKLLFAARRKKIRALVKRSCKSLEGFDPNLLEKRPDHLEPKEHLDLFKMILENKK